MKMTYFYPVFLSIQNRNRNFATEMTDKRESGESPELSRSCKSRQKPLMQKCHWAPL